MTTPVDQLQSQLDELQARVIATEIISRGALTAFALAHAGDAAIDFVDELNRQILESLQYLERPFDEQADRIWGSAVDAIDALFDEVRTRLRNIKAVKNAEGRP